MQVAGSGVGNDEIGFLSEERLVSCAGGSCENVFEEGLGDEAGGGQEDGFIF